MSSSRLFFRFCSAVFLEDWPLKLIGALLAALAWVYIDGELTDKREIPVAVPLGALKLPEDLQPETGAGITFEFRVTVRGPRRRLQYLSGENFRDNLEKLLQNSLAQPKPGRNVLTLRPGELEVKNERSMEVEELAPREVEVQLRRVFSRELPVRPVPQGVQRAGFKVTNMLPEPPQVLVRALHDLETAQYVPTEPIDVTEKAADFQVRVPLRPVAQAGEMEIRLLPNPGSVLVNVLIRQVADKKVLEAVPIRAIVPSGTAIAFEPRQLRVEIYGAVEDLAGLRPTDILLFLDWPAEWEIEENRTGQFPEQTVALRVVAPPRLIVRGENNQELPRVRVRGGAQRQH